MVCFLPYFIDMVKGKTKPRVVSWFIWSVLAAIACIAALIDGHYPTAIFLLLSSLAPMAVVVFGWRLGGDRSIEWLDIICLLGALIGVVLLVIFNSPAFAVIITIIIDLIGGVPTLVHAWRRPNEETWLEFALAGVAALCMLLVVNSWEVTAFVYPLYLLLINLGVMSIILFRKKRKSSKKKR
ncbi:MAG: hypothetical protein WCJ36_00365 [Candidatus Saccharibacteria bacterium]